MRARPWPRPVQVVVAILMAAIVVLATPTGLFLRTHIPSQVVALQRMLKIEGGAEARTRLSLGRDYAFLADLRTHTPDDAVILMSDQDAPSRLGRLKAKHQSWAAHVLYPRRILYLHQEEDPRYRDATYLILDGEASTYWIAPDRRPPSDPSTPAFVLFNMGAYLDAVDRGEIDARYRPPTRPLRGGGGR